MTLLGPRVERATALGRALVAVARAHDIELPSCAEPRFGAVRVTRGACVDGVLLNPLAADDEPRARGRAWFTRSGERSAPAGPRGPPLHAHGGHGQRCPAPRRGLRVL